MITYRNTSWTNFSFRILQENVLYKTTDISWFHVVDMNDWYNTYSGDTNDHHDYVSSDFNRCSAILTYYIYFIQLCKNLVTYIYHITPDFDR